MEAEQAKSNLDSTPHCLVIGAMKAGTTTLFHDLRRVSRVAVADKELSYFQRLATADIDTRQASAAYWSLFDRTEQTLCSVDVSTTYTMAPEIDGVPERAAAVLSVAPRLLYLVRNPIERAVSHHHHMIARGATSADFDSYVEAEEGPIGFGRYEVQAQRWIDAFGPDSLLVVRLEDYAQQWSTVMPQILEHMGVGAEFMPTATPDRMNSTADARVFTGTSRALMESGPISALYTKGVKRLVPDSLRTRIRNLVLPPPPDRPDAPSSAVLRRMVEEFSPTATWVGAQTGTEPWDLNETAEKLAR